MAKRNAEAALLAACCAGVLAAVSMTSCARRDENRQYGGVVEIARPDGTHKSEWSRSCGLAPRLVRTKAEYEAWRAQPTSAALARALDERTLNFDTHVLFLPVHREGHLGSKVRFEVPRVPTLVDDGARALAFSFHVKKPPTNHKHPATIQAFCHPVLIERSKVDTVILSTNDRQVFRAAVTPTPEQGPKG